MEKIIWIVLAFVAGCFLPLQVGMNSKMANLTGSSLYASAISFAVGLIALVGYILIVSRDFSLEGLKDAPAYAWMGGIVGAFYVTIVILAYPKLGPGLTLSLVVLGQLLFSMVMEHFRIMEAQEQSISLGRIIGLLLIVAGVIIMKKF